MLLFRYKFNGNEVLYMIHFLGRDIPLYGLCWILGIALAFVVALFLLKRAGLDSFDLACSALFVLGGVVIGAKLLFIIVSLPTIIELKLSPMELISGGFVFYGGLIGGALALLLYVKLFKVDLLKIVDVYAAVIPLGHACGRVGCFLGGCCYGMEYDGALSYTYSEGVLNATTPIGVPLLPVQLFEAASLLILFVPMLIVYFKKKPNQTGICGAIYLYAYAVIRFVLEYFRGDKERGSFLAFSTSQIISILIIAFVTVFILMMRKKNKAKAQAPAEE